MVEGVKKDAAYVASVVDTHLEMLDLSKNKNNFTMFDSLRMFKRQKKVRC